MPETQPKLSWIFFAALAKPSSARRALAYRLAEPEPVVVVGQAMSFLRRGGWCPGLRARVVESSRQKTCVEYTPIHYPERVPGIGRMLGAYGRHKLARELDSLLAPYGSLKRIVCFDSPSQCSLVGSLGEDVSVYLAIDDRTVTVAGEPIAGEIEAELKLLQRVDRVVCVSEILAGTLKKRAGARVKLEIDVLTNGYDERMFSPSKRWDEPTALRDVPHPRILVSGHISERLDWDGLAHAAKLRSNWAWIFVGPADAGMKERIASIRRESGAGLYMFAPVAYEDVPAWIAHCDAGAVPYRLNNFTRASSPLKAIEYLGAGAPVLSTRIPALASYGDAVSWVTESDGDSYACALDAIGKQERYGTAAVRRRDAVRTESWEGKAVEFRNLIEPSLALHGLEESKVTLS